MVLSTGFLKVFQDFLDFFESSFCVRLEECDLGNFGESLFFSGFLFHPSNLSEKMILSISFFVGRLGVEPRTNALKGRCSTIELPSRTRRENRTHPATFGESLAKPWDIAPHL